MLTACDLELCATDAREADAEHPVPGGFGRFGEVATELDRGVVAGNPAHLGNIPAG